ncbi:MAG TPA: signal peptidase II [Gemmatimonadales bacterium]|jgi:signal peptidase II
MAPKTRAFLAASLPLLLADRFTKILAYAQLEPPGIPHRFIGEVARLTLVFNREAAMNIPLGPWSRWGLAAIAAIGIIVMVQLLRQAPSAARLIGLALGLIAAGAAGNLIDRIRWDRGVIDFIDLGVGTHRFWTFNVADIGVTAGAILLALIYSRERPHQVAPVEQAEL